MSGDKIDSKEFYDFSITYGISDIDIACNLEASESK